MSDLPTGPLAIARRPTPDIGAGIGAPAHGRRPRCAAKRATTWTPYLFVSPFFILFASFGLFPLLFSIFLSFQQWDPATGLAAMRYAGFGNYGFVLTDPWFWKSVGNTLWMALAAGVPQHVAAISLAAFIDTSLKKLQRPVLGMYFLPYITSSVAIALIFGTLFSRNFGVINVVISCLSSLPGLSLLLPAQPIDWLGSYGAIKPAISFVLFWRYLGWNIVLYLAALQTIPAELYEAARLDGASAWKQFRHVSLPLLKPMMYFAVSMTVIGNLQIFEEPFILVGPAGGPAQAALTATMYMYRTAFDFNDFGAAAAMSWIMFVLICLAMLICRRLLGGENAGGRA